MITKRDEKTGAIIYLKSKDDLEKEKMSKANKDLTKRVSDLEQYIIKLEKDLSENKDLDKDKKIKNLEKRISKIETMLKDFIIDGE